jgi:hypothetical protein
MLTATPGDSLCVLGAGNLNDLDLDRLLGVFPELHRGGPAIGTGRSCATMTDSLREQLRDVVARPGTNQTELDWFGADIF